VEVINEHAAAAVKLGNTVHTMQVLPLHHLVVARTEGTLHHITQQVSEELTEVGKVNIILKSDNQIS
jgi:hypothetical protein